MTEPNPLGDAIRARREARGLSIARAAELCQISPARMRQLEKGYTIVNADVRVPAGTTARTVRLIARGLGLDTVALLHLAGFTEAAAEDDTPPVVERHVEAAIQADTHLSADMKHHLTGLYLSLVRAQCLDEQERDDFRAGLDDALDEEPEAKDRPDDPPNRRSTDLA